MILVNAPKFRQLLNRLKLWQKFAVMGLLGIFLFAPPLTLYVLETNKKIDALTGELAGIEPGRIAQQLLQMTQQHRGLSAAVLGAGELIAKREAKQDEVDQLLDRLETAIAKDARLRNLLGTVRADWTRLSRGVGARLWTPRESYNMHTVLCQRLTDVVQRIADESGLSLDSAADRYHMIRSAFVVLPEATEALGESRAKGASILAVHAIDEADRVLMYELMSRILSTQQELDEAMGKALDAKPDLKAELIPLLSTAMSNAQTAEHLERREIASATRIEYPVADYLVILTSTIDNHFKLLNVVMPAIENALQQNIAEEKLRRNTMIGLIGLLATLAAFTSWQIAISVLNPMQETLKIAQAISEGHFDTPITLDLGHGEGAHMLAALSQMQKALRQAMASELVARQDFFLGLLESAPEAMIIVDSEGQISLANDQTLKLFDYKREELIGQPIEILVPAAFKQQHHAHRHNFFKQPQMRPMAERGHLLACKKGGGEFPAEISLSPLITATGLVVSCTIRDISERKRAQQELQNHRDRLEELVIERTAELERSVETLRSAHNELVRAERLASLGALVAGISHDLNTPIGNAYLAASTLRDNINNFSKHANAGSLKKSEFEHFLSASSDMTGLIVRAIERATELITSFKQVAVDQTSERRREFNLKSTMEDVVATLRPGFKNRPWKIHVDVEANLNCDSYPGPLDQIVTNLILNASIHAFEGRERGNIWLTGRAYDAEQIELIVADDGIGMSAKTVEQAFDAFFTTKVGRGGSGLGLSICKGIAAGVIGGKLTLESSPGKGSSFKLIFPKIAP